MDSLAHPREQARLKAARQKGNKLDGILTKLEKQIERERRGVVVPNPGQFLRRQSPLSRPVARPAPATAALAVTTGSSERPQGGRGPGRKKEGDRVRGGGRGGEREGGRERTRGKKGTWGNARVLNKVQQQSSIMLMLQKDDAEHRREAQEESRKLPHYAHGMQPPEEEFVAYQCARVRSMRKGGGGGGGGGAGGEEASNTLTLQEVRDVMRRCGASSHLHIRDLRELTAEFRSDGAHGLAPEAFLAFIFKYRLENMKLFENVEWSLQGEGAGKASGHETGVDDATAAAGNI